MKQKGYFGIGCMGMKTSENFEPDNLIRNNGITPLLWVRDEILALPDEFADHKYICLQWANAQRRDVYKRLLNYGFRISRVYGELVLIKDIN